MVELAAALGPPGTRGPTSRSFLKIINHLSGLGRLAPRAVRDTALLHRGRMSLQPPFNKGQGSEFSQRGDGIGVSRGYEHTPGVLHFAYSDSPGSREPRVIGGSQYGMAPKRWRKKSMNARVFGGTCLCGR